MTVEELIERLKQFDPKLPVTVRGPGGRYVDMYEEVAGPIRCADGIHCQPADSKPGGPAGHYVKEGPHVRIG